MMRAEPVDSLDDPRLDDYRNLRDASLQRRRHACIAESLWVVERLLSPASRYAARSLLVSEPWLDDVRPVVESSAQNPVVFVAPPDVLDGVIGHHFHHGVLACAERGEPARAEDVLAGVPEGRALAVATEGLVDHDNVGSIFRNASAFGAACVLMSPRCADPLYRKAVRTSMGHVLTMPWARCERWPDELGRLRERGFRIVALTPAADAQEIGAFARTLDADARVALLLGSEGPGLSVRAQSMADARVRIAIAPGADSINVAAASAVALHRLGGGDRH
ncbi:MAG: RNA methyltransferase [Phycisphaerales bacterium]|nr:MAG: RNA methyltransferase [Phycisphaerales bacterium]